MSAPEGRSWFLTARLSSATAWNHPDQVTSDAEQGLNGNELHRLVFEFLFFSLPPSSLAVY